MIPPLDTVQRTEETWGKRSRYFIDITRNRGPNLLNCIRFERFVSLRVSFVGDLLPILIRH